MGIVLVGSAIVIVLGILFGILLAKTGRRRNILAESILNAVTAIPPVAYLIIFIGIWGNSIPTMLVALTASLTVIGESGATLSGRRKAENFHRAGYFEGHPHHHPGRGHQQR